MSPAKVTEVRVSDDLSQADVIVPDFQLSLAIGKEGQNARLAARLTGVRIDIKSETQDRNEKAGIFVDSDEYAEGSWVLNSDTGEHEWHAADGTIMTAAEVEAANAARLAGDDAPVAAVEVAIDGDTGSDAVSTVEESN